MANFSTRCNFCRQLINLKVEQVREAVAEVEAKHGTHYELHCPQCRRLIKVPLKELKKKLPIETTEQPNAGESTASE